MDTENPLQKPTLNNGAYTSVNACDIPEEMWVEILTGLQIKYRLRCRSVCKSWKRIVRHLMKKVVSLPLGGLVLRPRNARKPGRISHLCLGSRRIFEMQRTHSNQITVTCSSESLRGLFDSISLNFGVPYTIHRGFVLITCVSGTYVVCNPVTKQEMVLPLSPVVKQFGGGERSGMVIRLFCSPDAQRCHFAVMRLCRERKVIEVFLSWSFNWTTSKLELDDALLEAKWSFQNYVVLLIDETVTLFFLTNTDSGVAVKIKSSVCPATYAYGFRLPELAQDGFKKARLGACNGYLHLCYFDLDGIWIWKHDGSSVSADAWVPLLEISTTRQLCKPVAREHIAKAFEAGYCIIPLAFHPENAVLFLKINSCIFSYDMTDDSIDRIVEADDEVFNASAEALPYTPCLDSFYALKQHIKRLRMRKRGHEMFISDEEAEKRGYDSLTEQVDSILASTLYAAASKGNEGDVNWKQEVFHAVVDEVKSKFGATLKVEHVKYRIKVWKEFYNAIMDIRTNTQFEWDEGSKMVKISLDEFDEWLDYCKTRPKSRKFLNKIIKNWDDICELVGSSGVMAEGVEFTDDDLDMDVQQPWKKLCTLPCGATIV